MDVDRIFGQDPQDPLIELSSWDTMGAVSEAPPNDQITELMHVENQQESDGIGSEILTILENMCHENAENLYAERSVDQGHLPSITSGCPIQVKINLNFR